jgi:ubiquinone/menaquinone biosynthesis C-methylase UbiE
MAQKYLEPTYGGVLLDVSCGSGLFTRRFAELDLFSAVIAIDFSENMLRQTLNYIMDDEPLLKR